MTTPDEPTTPQPPDPAHEISLCARDLWESFGAQWLDCRHCTYHEEDKCPLENWRACDFMQHEVLNAGEKNMVIPEEPFDIPQPPPPAEQISICVRDLWEAYGGQWPECIHCPNLELETCSLQDWRGCDLMQQALINAGGGR